MPVRIWHLYPSDMNIYGDRGNVMVLTQRARWRGIDVEVHTADVGEPIDAANVDLVFAGGGQDDQQVAVSRDLQGSKGEILRKLAEDDVPMLVVCGTYQLFGHYFRPSAGPGLPGISLIDAYTEAGSRRMIGNALADTDFGVLVGFENHSGRTFLGAGCKSLGRVMVGGGNNGEDGGEGALYRYVHGTYLHGPVLPKNPWLADRLLAAALRHRGMPSELVPLHDDEEVAAHASVAAMARGARRNTSIR